MEEEGLDHILQHALLALHDIKPADPIKFLAEHFQVECEKNLVDKAVHLLQGMTVYHPAIEERLIQAYAIVSKCNSDDALSGDIYSDFLQKLIAGIPLHQKRTFLEYFQCQSTEFVPYVKFRAGVLASMRLNQFVRNVRVLFSKLCIENHDSAPPLLCKIALQKIYKHLAKNLKKSTNNCVESNSLGITELNLPIPESLPDNLHLFDQVKISSFVSDAVEIFFREMPKLE